LRRLIAENAVGDKARLCPVGGRTSLHYGGLLNPESVLISTAQLDAVVDYPVGDMTITVEAGIRVEKLQSILAEHNQQLPIDIPQSHRATVGGVIACNTRGSRQYGSGTLRDYLIGVSAVDGRGRHFSAGGRVVKNVAGYDICKLMIGSLGTLAVVTQVTLMTRPIPACRTVVSVAFKTVGEIAACLDMLNTTQTRPVVLDVLNAKAVWQVEGESGHRLTKDHAVLIIGFEGVELEVNWQCETVMAELNEFTTSDVSHFQGESASELFNALTEYRAASDDPLTFRAVVPSSRTCEFMSLAEGHQIALQAHAGNGTIIGHLPDRTADARAATEIIRPLREFAEKQNGALTILNCDTEWIPNIELRGTPPTSIHAMRRLKSKFDPDSLLNSEKMWTTQ